MIGQRLADLLQRSIGGEDPSGLQELVQAEFVEHHSEYLAS
jgi:LacI family transcriptional regulator